MTAKDAKPSARSRAGSLLRTAGGAVGRATGAGADRSSVPPAVEEAGDTATGKSATKKTATKKATAKTAAAQPVSKRATAKKATAPRPTGKRTATGNAPARSTVGTSAASAAGRGRRAATESTPVNKKVTVNKKTRTTAVSPADLVVREDESPWTAEELAEVQAELSGDVERLESELRAIEADIAGLIKDSSSGAGDDQADVGSKAFERDHEYTLAQNNRTALAQAQHALERIEDGSYGVCENCGNPIGKMRLQAFPRATLCMACKQKERR